MKKYLLPLFINLSLVSLQAQVCGGPAPLDEKFETGIPGNWTILNLDGDVPHPSMVSKGYTGQFQPHVRLGRNCIANTAYLANFGPPDDYIITPAITLGSGPHCLSWKGCSYQPLMPDGYEVRLSTVGATQNDMQAGVLLYTVSSEPDVWTEHSVDLSPYANSTVYIGFWHNTAGYVLFLDDIRVSDPVSRDASVTFINMQDVVVPGTHNVAVRMLNAGTSYITSMDMNWNVNNGPVYTMNIPSINLPQGSYYTVTNSTAWNPTVNGTYTIKAWASNINGQSDQYTGNDTLARTVFVNTYPRKVLMEEFTQASCPPCAVINPYYDSLVDISIHNNTASSIHYQVAWPGYDPMNLFDPGPIMERVNYNGITSVPNAVMDGILVANDCGQYSGYPGCLSPNEISTAASIPSIFDLQVSNSPNGNIMNVTVTLTAKTDFPLTTFRLFTAVIEDSIIYNVAPGTNGETIFPQVMRLMLPDSAGQLLSPMTNNQQLTFNYSYTIDPAFVPSRLGAVSYVQDDVNKKVYQSAESYYYSGTGMSDQPSALHLSVYPNPSSGTIFIRTEDIIPGGMNWSVMNVLGERLLEGKFNTLASTHSDHIDISALPAGMYFLQLQVGSERMSVKIVKE